MTSGPAATHTHYFRRHGALSLLPALDLRMGQVYSACKARHRHQEFLDLMRQWVRRVPTPTVHLFLDHYANHKHHKVQAWQDA